MNECTRIDTVGVCVDRISGMYCRAERPCAAESHPVRKPPILPMLALDGDRCTLGQCRLGLFLFEMDGKADLCLKVLPPCVKMFEVYCSTGGAFWACTETIEEYEALIVQPVKIVTEQRSEIEDQKSIG